MYSKSHEIYFKLKLNESGVIMFNIKLHDIIWIIDSQPVTRREWTTFTMSCETVIPIRDLIIQYKTRKIFQVEQLMEDYKMCFLKLIF